MLALVAGAIASAISWSGYAGIVALMAMESACLPLPSEIIMPFAGYLVTTGRFSLWAVATAGAVGCNVGSAIAYAVGYYGGRPFVRRWGRYVLLSEHELIRVEAFFRRFGALSVFLARLLPVIRTFVALPAGVARMGQARFHIYTFLGSWPWCFGLAWIGYKLGDQWNNNAALRSVFHGFDLAIGRAILIGVGWLAWRKWSAARAPVAGEEL